MPRVDELPETTSVAPTDRVLVLKNPGTTPTVETIDVSEISPSTTPTVVVTKSDANVNLPTVASTWTDVFSDGTSTARPTDLVFPASTGISVGDWVEITLETVSAATAAHVFLDMAIVVAGAVVRRTRSDVSGALDWILPASTFAKVGAPITYQIQSGDFEANGDVRFRLQANNANTTARTLQIASGYYLRLEGRGPLA